MDRRFGFAAALALAAMACGPVSAQDGDGGWKVSVTPYLWVSAFESDTAAPVDSESVESEASFGDLLENLQGVFIGKGEVQYDRVGVYADLIYLKLTAEQTVQRPLLGEVERDADLATTAATLSAFYRAVATDQLDVDVLAGVRYVDLELDLDSQGAGPALSAEGSQSETAPIVGVRATQRIGSRTSLTGYGDYGGFGGSMTAWQVYGAWNYHWTPKLTGSLGYRYFAIEIDEERVRSDVNLSGPFVALTWQF